MHTSQYPLIASGVERIPEASVAPADFRARSVTRPASQITSTDNHRSA